MNALGLAYSSDDSDEDNKSNVSLDSKSSSGMSHKSVNKADDGEVLSRSRNNSFEGDSQSSQDSKFVQKCDCLVNN
jgi:flagellar basal body L-ring protein FlgH